MKKQLFSLVLVITISIGMTIPVLAAENNSFVSSQSWQDGVFNNGVYEGYYAQLDDFQKMLYNKIKEAFAEPTYAATIEFDEPVLVEAEAGGSFTEEDEYQWMCDNINSLCSGRYAVFRDHPELPWLLAADYRGNAIGEYIYNDQGVCTGYYISGIYYENTYPWVQPEAYTDPSALEKAADDAVAAISETHPNRAATLRAIFDYLCNLITYKDRTATIPDKYGGEAHTVYYDHTSYSVLVAPNEGVCTAYASAFKLLCDRYGIPCVHLSGETPAGSHAWNYVQLEDGSWYAVDLTWADGEVIDYGYFLAGKSSVNLAGDSFEVSHEVPASNGGLSCPPLSDTAYPYINLSSIPEIAEPGLNGNN